MSFQELQNLRKTRLLRRKLQWKLRLPELTCFARICSFQQQIITTFAAIFVDDCWWRHTNSLKFIDPVDAENPVVFTHSGIKKCPQLNSRYASLSTMATSTRSTLIWGFHQDAKRPGAHLSLNVLLFIIVYIIYICFTCKEDTQRSCVMEGFGIVKLFDMNMVKLHRCHNLHQCCLFISKPRVVTGDSKSSDAQPSIDFRLEKWESLRPRPQPQGGLRKSSQIDSNKEI